MDGLPLVAWAALGAGLLLGALGALAFAYLYRRRILRAVARRELSRTRKLIAQGRTDEAALRLRRLVREGVYSDDIPELALAELAELYRGSRAREQVARIRDMVVGVRSHWRRAPRGDVRERLRALERALDELGPKE